MNIIGVLNSEISSDPKSFKEIKGIWISVDISVYFNLLQD